MVKGTKDGKEGKGRKAKDRGWKGRADSRKEESRDGSTDLFFPRPFSRGMVAREKRRPSQKNGEGLEGQQPPNRWGLPSNNQPHALAVLMAVKKTKSIRIPPPTLGVGGIKNETKTCPNTAETTVLTQDLGIHNLIFYEGL